MTKIDIFKITLFFCLLFELFIFLSLVSFIAYSWNNELFFWNEKSIHFNNVKNIGGVVGHFFSNLLIINGFGICTILVFPFIINLTLNYIISKKIFNSIKLFFHTFFWLVWFLLFFGYLPLNKDFYIGKIGKIIYDITNNFIGIGIIIYLIFSLFLYLNIIWILRKNAYKKKQLNNNPTTNNTTSISNTHSETTISNDYSIPTKTNKNFLKKFFKFFNFKSKSVLTSKDINNIYKQNNDLEPNISELNNEKNKN